MEQAKPTSDNVQKEELSALWLTAIVLDDPPQFTSRGEMARVLGKRGIRTRAFFAFRKVPIEVPGFYKTTLFKLPSNSVLAYIYLNWMLFLHILRSPERILITNYHVVPHAVAARVIDFLLRRHRRRTYVLDVRSGPVNYVGTFRGFLKITRYRIGLFLARWGFDGLSVITEKMKENILAQFGFQEDRVCVWTSGVNFSLFHPRSDSVALKARLYGTVRFVLLHHGVLDYNRGIENVVRAVQMLKEEFSHILFVILGKGPIEAKIQKMIKENALEEHVRLLGRKPYAEVPLYIAGSDIGVVPLLKLKWWEESSPLKLIEYLAVGKPVLVTDIWAHRSVLDDSPAGFFIADSTPALIADKLREIMGLPDLTERGAIGHQIASTNYDWNEMGAAFAAFLRNLAEGKEHKGG